MRSCVIIPTFNSLDITTKIVKELLINQKNKNFDIIVVDMGSEDYKELEKYFGNEKRVYIIHSEKDLGGSGSFWLGMKFAYDANYDVFILTDNDCFPLSETLIDEILENIETFGFLKPSDVDREEEEFVEPGKIALHFLSLKRDVVEKIGFPRIEFMIFCDDVDYGKRLGKIKVIKSYYRHLGKQTFDPNAFSKRLYYHVRNNLLLVILDFIKTRRLLEVGRIFSMLWRFLLPSLISKRTFDYIKFVIKAFRDAVRLKIGKEHELKSFEPIFFKTIEHNKRREKIRVPIPSAQKSLISYLGQFLRSYFSLFKFLGKNIEVSQISDYSCIVTTREVKYKEYVLRPKFLRNLVLSSMIFPLLAFLITIIYFPIILKLNRSKYINKLRIFFEVELSRTKGIKI